MEFKVIEYNTIEYIEMVELRNTVLLEPIGLPYFDEVFTKDEESLHCACYQDNEMIACCILTALDENAIQLRQMAVAVEKQSQKVGAKLIAFAQKVAKEHSYTQIILNARRAAEKFYLQNGYEFVGEEFEEVGLPHMKMKKTL